uniref:Ion transport domain-containing protein n=1 Tax=Trichogramma kaykai TaxID=54128 RepID=A0ABD2XPE6_9HYME
MSSGAKRFVQSLRGRNVTTSNNSSSNNNNNNNNNSGSSHHLHQHHRSGSGSSHDIGGGGGASASTSATRLFDRYDSGHELDEISVIGRSGPDDYTAAATTPTTPYHQQQQQQQLHHHYSSGGAAPISPAATVIGGSSLGSVGLNKQYDSRQTLYSIAGSMPNSQASGAASNNRLITPAGIVTAGGSIVTSGELRERHRQTATRSGSCASGRLIDDDLDDLDETRSGGGGGGGVFSSRQSFIDLVSSRIISNARTPTHFYHHQPQLQSSGGDQQYFGSSRDSLHHQQAYVNRGASELDLSGRGGKDKAARQLGIKDSRVAAASSKAAAARSNFKLANCNTGMQTNNCMLNSSGAMMNTATTTTTMTTIPSREMTPSHLSVTPSSINHLVGNSACNGTETRYSYQQQQQQRGSRGYPGQSGQRGFRTGAPNWSFVFDPAGRLCYYWSMVVSLAFLYNFWVIIYRFAFQEINGETIVVWFCLDYLSDFLYVADIVFHFRTGYLEDGVLQTDATKLSQHYMNSTTFYIDCLCLLPLDFLYLSIGFNSILRSFRLVKIYRFWAFMDRTERHTNYPNLFRSTSLIHYLLVIFHWNGCLYHIIYKNNGFGSKDWVFADSETADVVKQYLQSYYWCTLALTTIGDLPRPRTKGEYLFVIAQLLFGLLLFATVLGHVANIVTSVSAARKEFQGESLICL